MLVHKAFTAASNLRASSIRTRAVAATTAPQTTKMAPLVTDVPLVLSNWGCPYVQRVTLALAHKGQKFSPQLGASSGEGGLVRELEIDLANKPDWILKYSPLSKVPAITYTEDGKERVLYESLPLIQWVDEFYQGPALLPASPAERVLARIIINRFDGSVIPTFYGVLRATDKAQYKEAALKLNTELSWLEQHVDPTGPFLLGSKPSLVDAAVAPWLLRTAVIKHWRGVDILAKHPRLAAFAKSYKQLPEVQAVLRTADGSVGYDTWSEAIVKPAAKWAGDRVDYSDVDLTA